MAFLIPDNVRMRSGVALPLRRVLTAFQAGLDDEVTVWYEPPFDPLGEKPHLVALLPGLGLALLEVLELDPSCVLGLFRGRVRLFRDGREVETESPLVRAERLRDALLARLALDPLLAKLELPVQAGCVMPALSRADAEERGLAGALDFSRILFQEAVESARSGPTGGLGRALEGLFEGGRRAPLDARAERRLRGLLHPDTVIGPAPSSPVRNEPMVFRPAWTADESCRVMDRQQENLAKRLGGGHRVLRGVAGSGKTLVLVYRAKLLSRLQPAGRFLLTCFTRALAGELRAELAGCDNVEVTNLDRLMREAISEAGLEFPGYEDVSKVRTAALEAQRQGAGPRFDGVLLDEAQDFDTEALRFAVGLLRPGRDELVVAADASQNIFRARGSWKQAGIQAQGRTLVLRVNYRNTRQILEFAQRFLTSGADAAARSGGDLDGDDAPLEPESALRAGPLPEVRQVPTAKAEAEAVAELVQAWLPSHTGPRCLGILYGSTLDSGVDRPRLIEARLRELGLPCFWANDPEDRGAKDRYCRVSSPVVLCTIQSAKGLEFPSVILCGPFRENLPAIENRRLAYVGMTRATERLAVVVRQSHPLARDLRV